MIDKFQNIMRQQASLVSNSVAQSALGTVVAYDQLNHYASVQLYPADPTDPTSIAMITGMLPIFSQWVGAGWGFFTPPSIGDIVDVHFQEGSIQNGYISLRTWNESAPPLNVPSGEAWLVHQSGSFIKMTNDGNISINTPNNVNITCNTANVNATASANVTAPAINLDGVVEMGNLSASLTGLMNSVAIGVYNSHTHNLPSGVSDIPNQLLDSSSLTNNVKAN